MRKNRVNNTAPYPYDGTNVHEGAGTMDDYPYDDGRLRYKEAWGFENPSYGIDKPVKVLPVFYLNILQYQF